MKLELNYVVNSYLTRNRNGRSNNTCVVAGVLNCSDNVIHLNKKCNAILAMINELNLTAMSSLYKGALLHTYVCDYSGHISCIDNIYMSNFEAKQCDIMNADVLNDSDNDHYAINVVIRFVLINNMMNNESMNEQFRYIRSRETKKKY
jgi:hypothetical protein